MTDVIINDPLGQTHNSTSSDHFCHLKIVLFCVMDERTDAYERHV